MIFLIKTTLLLILLWGIPANDVLANEVAAHVPITANSNTFIDVVLPREANIIEYGRRLAHAGVIKRPWYFLYKAFSSARITPGRYRLQPNMSVNDLLQIISKKASYIVRIPEGLTVYEIARHMHKKSFIKGALFQFPQEGALLPATYAVAFEERIENVVRKMEKAMNDTCGYLWKAQKQQQTFPFTKQQWITLASIVEKETGVREERTKIAAVFLNRLKINMPLQADPTVIYAHTLGRTPLNRTLTRNDTKLNSPYNTYVTKGLPPAPIACPGKAALKAVLEPADCDDLYFVADGLGGHRFAKTLDAHNRNVQQWKHDIKNKKNINQ